MKPLLKIFLYLLAFKKQQQQQTNKNSQECAACWLMTWLCHLQPVWPSRTARRLLWAAVATSGAALSPWRWRRLRRHHNTGFSVTAVNVKLTPNSRWVTFGECFFFVLFCFLFHTLLCESSRRTWKERGREAFGFFLESYLFAFESANRTDRFVTAGSWIILTGIAWSVTPCLLWWMFVCVKRAHRSYIRGREGERESNLVIHAAIFRSTTVGDFVQLSTVNCLRET